MKLVIDASKGVLGRVASYAAKQALLGKDVTIVNCSNLLITGERRMIINEYKTMVYRGGHSLNGPFHIKRNPERIMKRTIRGMLSYKQGRGDAAFKRIMCHNDIPAEFANEKMVKFEKTHKGRGIALKELVKEL